MRSAVVALLSGVVGLVAGVLVYGWFAAHSLGMWNRIVQTEFATEQEFRAARAEREGDLLAALHHRWNVVEAGSPDWLRMFQTWEAPAPWFAAQFSMLGRMFEGADPSGRGERVVHAIARGQLARLLEANGHVERAAHEWGAAAQLSQRDEQRMRELVASLHGQETSGTAVRAEDAVLGPVHVEP
jgi:hypothetical protein